MLSRQCEEALDRAVNLARSHHHEYVTLEHALLVLLDLPEIQDVVAECGGDLEKLKARLEAHVLKEVPRFPDLKPGETAQDPHPTLALKNLVQTAAIQVQLSGKEEVRPIDLFAAIFNEKDTHALFFLREEGIERLDVLSLISHGIESSSEETAGEGEEEAGGGASGKKAAQDPLRAFTQNLNELARQGKIDPLIGRQLELERMIQTLCRRRKNNPLLVGEAGVGKTALAEGLALRIVEGKVPSILKEAEIFALDLGSLLAGSKYRGDFEQRIKRVLGALSDRKKAGKTPILFIDEIHTLVGAGSVSGGVMDASNLLKPALSRGELRCVGSTTYGEYRTTFEKDAALNRRFQKIDVPEPSIEEAVQILEGLRANFEAHHGVKYAPEALRAAVELSAKHLTGRFLPDKAIDVIDEVGAKSRLARTSDEEIPLIDVLQIEEVISQIARIPARSVSTGQKTRLKNLGRDLKLLIFGQDDAIEAVVNAIQLARSGLRTGDRPVGSFLFAGPTGVGKTELSRQLARALGVPFQRFDMSEYSEKHTVSRLVGAPPGYVGFEQAGLLTDAVIKQPHSVILLDEIEKAHSDIWNILLQVMDHGTLTDNNGRKADFRQAVLLMTSNVGSRESERRPLGLGGEALDTGAAQKAVDQVFAPEFRNRLDGIVHFKSLGQSEIGQVVSKQLLELEQQLLAKNVEAEFTPELREWLGKKGFDRRLGARPLARVIQDRIKKALAQELLFGKLENGGKVRVSVEGDAPKFECTSRPATAEKSEKAEKVEKPESVS